MPVAELEEELDVIDYTRRGVPKGYELIDGQLTKKPEMGAKASWVASELHGELRTFLRTARVGVSITAEAGYRCFPHRTQQVRKPDVSRLLCDPRTFIPTDPYFLVAPAISVEVVSPHETYDDLEDKIDDFLKAGTKLVWVIHPEKRRVTIHYPDLTTRQIDETGTLSGEDVLPGFAIPLASILPPK